MESQYGLIYEKINLDNLNIAYEIQKNIWKDEPDYDDLYDKATDAKDDNCFFIVHDKDNIIGITGVDVYREYPDTIWLDWYAILPEYRRKGYGEKVLLDTIMYCKNLNRFNVFRIETTYYKDRPVLFLYDKVMQSKAEYTAEDTDDKKLNVLIYSYSLNGKIELWNNKYLGLTKYYEKLKEKKIKE